MAGQPHVGPVGQSKTVDNGVEKVTIVAKLRSGATVEWAMDAAELMVDTDYPISAMGFMNSQGYVSSVVPEPMVTVKITGRWIYQDSEPVTVPKFSSQEEAQAWLDSQSTEP